MDKARIKRAVVRLKAAHSDLKTALEDLKNVDSFRRGAGIIENRGRALGLIEAFIVEAETVLKKEEV